MVKTLPGMKPKTLLLLLGTLVVLLGIAYFSRVLDRDITTIDVPEIDIPTEEVTALSITLPDDAITLVKSGMAWMVTSPVEALSDSATVSRFLSDLGDLSIESIASNNPERYAEYGVDSTAAQVTMTWGEQEQTLVISQSGPDFQSVFLRLGDDPRVLVTRGRLSVARSVDRWRDKRILHLPALSIASVSVRRPDGPYALQRGAGGWEIDGAPADSASVEAFVRRFGSMRADGFFDDLPAVILEDAPYEVAIQTISGTTEVLRALEHENAVALTRASGQATFRLTRNRLDSFFPDPTTLQKEGL